jgi:hypothetical protein
LSGDRSWYGIPDFLSASSPLEPFAENVKARSARHWRAKRSIRFADRQARERQWIAFSELAERYARNIGISEGYEALRRAVIDGEFERADRCRVLYLTPSTLDRR